MKHLHKILQDRPDINVIYFNEIGGWSLNVSNLHPIKKTRDEVLAISTEEEKTEDQKRIEELEKTNYLQAQDIESLKKLIEVIKKKKEK